jgi:GT2 family glycosyltransferase/2-polyprenyl-3-methyl-5-hydroxy-6-metoxy-1,4-benzoquinol methylase
MKFTGEFFVPDEKYRKLSEDRELAIEHLQRYNTILPLVANKDVLDIASGEGYGSNILASGAASVIGVDINEELVAHATEKYAKDNLSFKAGNVVAMPLEDACVDVVVSFETLEHVNEEAQQKFLQEIRRVLKKEGILIISTPNKANYTDRFNHINEFHVKELDEAAFVSLLKQNFPRVELFNQGQEIVSMVFNKEKYIEQSPVPSLPIVKDHFRLQGKYLLAVCGKSEKKQLPDISSVVVEGNKSFFDLTERIVQLQDEVEQLGAWGRRSAAEVEQMQGLIAEQNKARENNEKIINEKEKVIAEKNAVIKQFDELMVLREKLHQDSESVIRVKNDIITQLEQLLILRDKMFQDTEKANKENQTKLKEFQKKIDEEKTITENLSNRNLKLNQEKDNLQAEKSRMQAELNVEIRQIQIKSEEDIRKKEKEIAELSEEISKLSREVQEQSNNSYRIETQKLLLQQTLDHIYGSEGWKMLSIYYKIKGKLLPEESGRYKTLKKWFQVLKRNKNPEKVFTVVAEQETKPVVAQPVIVPEEHMKWPVVFPVFDKIEVSIVMPAYNNWEFTRNCLLSIHKYNDGVPFEIIVGDNVSTDDTQKLPQYFTNVNYIRNPENLGYIKNVNNAASKAKGKYILTLNNDTTVTEGWLINLVKVMEADPKAGLVGSKLVYPDGSLQEAGGIVWKDASGWNYGRGSDPDLPEYNYVKEADYISGASNLVRRELWEKLQGLDLRYVPAYFDDSDLAFGIRRLGYKVIYQPLSVVVHYEGLTHGTNTTEGTKQYQMLNLEKFKQKWKEELKHEQFPNGEHVFVARDRSRSKKTILVVDHYVPQFDKDAGSRTVFQYLKLFVSLDFNVKFIGDNFYRHEPYTTVLQQMGIEVLYGPWYWNHWQKWIKNNHDEFDYVLLNRPHISVKYIDFIKENTKARILYYGHDLHYVRMAKQYEVENKKELLDEAARWKDVETSLFSKADVVLAPSKEESDLIKELGVNNRVYPIKPYIFDRIPEALTDFSSKKDILFIGGFTHVPNVDAVIWFVKEVWPLVKQEVKGARFIIAGSNPPAEVTSLAASDIDVLGYVSDEALTKLYAGIKLVVIPLRYGAGVKGKTVEAMYNGVPIVSTSFGTEGLPGNVSFLAPKDNPADFANEVTRLYVATDEELVTFSQNEVKYIYEHFYVETVKAEFMGILDELTGRKKKEGELIK